MVPQAAAEPGTMTARPPGEPNVQQQLANDRTLLAWVRTAIALAGLGFVVARFGLFLRELSGGTAVETGHSSRYLGVGLVCLGAVVMLFGLTQYRSVGRVLARHGDLSVSPRWPALVTGLLCFTAILVVAIYLLTGVR